jgi:hypothetical protein
MRTLLSTALAAAALVAGATAALADARTTRIEPRPFYGATVTLEAGVRVFRPLPPHDRVIINPGGKTPLSLSYSEYYGFGDGGGDDFSGADVVGPGMGGFSFLPGRHLHNRHKMMRHFRAFRGGHKH